MWGKVYSLLCAWKLKIRCEIHDISDEILATNQYLRLNLICKQNMSWLWVLKRTVLFFFSFFFLVKSKTDIAFLSTLSNQKWEMQLGNLKKNQANLCVTLSNVCLSDREIKTRYIYLIASSSSASERLFFV
jgi:hypothetical protein